MPGGHRLDLAKCPLLTQSGHGAGSRAKPMSVGAAWRGSAFGCQQARPGYPDLIVALSRIVDEANVTLVAADNWLR
jgi:hypothetical protein